MDERSNPIIKQKREMQMKKRQKIKNKKENQIDTRTELQNKSPLHTPKPKYLPSSTILKKIESL